MKQLMNFREGHIPARPAGRRVESWSWLLLALLFFVFTVNGCGADLDDATAARVGGRVITMSALDKAVRPFSHGAGDENPAAIRRRVLAGLIEEELILAEADRLGVRVSDKELDRRVQEIRNDFPAEAFNETLLRNFMDFDTWKADLRRNLLIEKTTRQALAARVRVDPDEWEKYFAQHADPTPSPERILVRHLTFADRKQAEKAHKQLASGRDWDEVAGEMPGAETGRLEPGRTIWTRPDKLDGPIKEALTGIGPGQVSEVIDLGKAFAIFGVMEVEKPTLPTPEEVLADVRRRYLRDQEALEYGRWVGELKQRYKIVIHPGLSGKANGG